MISNLAYIDSKAQLGQNVTVEPFAYISGDVQIGDGSWIGPHAVILDGARIGRNCKIHSSAVVAGVPQDLKFRGEYTTAVVGDNTTIRECCTINRGTAAKGTTTVGSDTLLMAYVHVGHDCVVGDHVVLVNRVSLAGEVEVGDWAIIGGHAGVHQFVRVGAHSMTAGISKVSRDVAPFITVSHDPLSFLGINSIGLRRRGFTTEQVAYIHDIYRIIFQSGLSVSSAVARVEQDIAPSDIRAEILSFIASSKRGLTKPYNTRCKDNEIEL
ncbi:MAG: acyl-ACP--UDP-N-acetylglucosamine O-acyltransferase [Mucinivorans sp.]